LSVTFASTCDRRYQSFLTFVFPRAVLFSGSSDLTLFLRMLAALLVVENNTNSLSMGGGSGIAQTSLSSSSSAGGNSSLTFQKRSNPSGITFGTVRHASVASGGDASSKCRGVCLSEREDTSTVRSRSSSVHLAHPERLGGPGPEPVSPLSGQASTDWEKRGSPSAPSFLAGNRSLELGQSQDDVVSSLCLRLACQGVQGRSFDGKASGSGDDADEDVKSWAEVASNLDVENLLSGRAPPSTTYEDDNLSVLSSMSCDADTLDSRQRQPSPRIEYPGAPRFKGNFVAAPLPLLARNGRRSRGKSFQHHHNRSPWNEGTNSNTSSHGGDRSVSRGVDMGSRCGGDVQGGNRGTLSKSRGLKSRGGIDVPAPLSPASWWKSDDSSGRQYELPSGRHIARVPSPSTLSSGQQHQDQSSLPGVKRVPQLKALSGIASHREDLARTPVVLSPRLSPSTPSMDESSTQLFHRVPKASPSRSHASKSGAPLIAANVLTSPLARSGASAVSGFKPPSPLSPTSPTSASLALSSSASRASLDSGR